MATATAERELLERGERLKREGIVIRTYDIWKSYVMGDQEIHAVSGVDIEIKRGEYVAIMGPSGSGKSTLIYAGISSKTRIEMAKTAMRQVDLENRMDHKPNELSGGQRQRVAIARALVNNPSILLADEPTGNLDTATGNEIMALFDKLHQKGNTIVLVTHEHDVALYAHRVVTIRDGKVEKDEPTPRATA